MTLQSKKVAVLGAGAAGLVTAFELLQQQHSVKVFERSKVVGGAWVYTESVEDDPLGLTPSQRIHSSLYADLRTNLPRDLMAYEDYTFDSSGGGEDNWPRYPSHHHVLEYLTRYAKNKQIMAHIKFDHEVRELVPASGNWSVDGEIFDAVAICNGHYAEPHVPEVPEIGSFHGMVMHSHNYRKPKAFVGDRVIVFGTSASGADISRELAAVSECVFFSGKAFHDGPPLSKQTGPLKRCATIAKVTGDTVHLVTGEAIANIDAIIFCTGYRYSFPFLDEEISAVQNNHVTGLYKQLVNIELPTLAFIGLPFRIVPFPVFQRQARWFARLLSSKFTLPGRLTRQHSLRTEMAELARLGRPERHFHLLGNRQIPYMNDLARQCGDEPLEAWFEALWREHHDNVLRHPASYREQPLSSFGLSRVSVPQ